MAAISIHEMRSGFAGRDALAAGERFWSAAPLALLNASGRFTSVGIV